MGLDKLLQRGVPRDSYFARPHVAFDRLERLQAENVFGVDRIRVAAQGLDPGDAQRARAKLNRRSRRRPYSGPELGRLIESARKGEVAPAALLRVGKRLRACAGRGDETLQKTRGDGRLAAAFLRPAQDRLGRPERGDEIMRRLADSPLRRREAERGAHRPVEKGVGVDRGRPDRFVEARQQHAIEAEQARFEQAEDLQARVAAARRRSARSGPKSSASKGSSPAPHPARRPTSIGSGCGS